MRGDLPLGIWGWITAGIVGCIIGVRFRIGALIAATLLAAAIAAAGVAQGLLAAGEAVLAVALLQLGYLAGVVLSSLGRRTPR